MKTIIAVTALVASVASASAMTASTSEIERYVGAEQAATLSPAEVLAANNFIHSSDSEGEKRAFVIGLVK